MTRNRRNLKKEENNSIYEIVHNVCNMYCRVLFKRLNLLIIFKPKCRYSSVGLQDTWEFGKPVASAQCYLTFYRADSEANLERTLMFVTQGLGHVDQNKMLWGSTSKIVIAAHVSRREMDQLIQYNKANFIILCTKICKRLFEIWLLRVSLTSW